MNVISFIYNQLLRLYTASRGKSIHKHLVIRGMIEIFVKLLNTIIDPEVRTKIRGKNIYLPLSHRLPINTIDYEYYDELPHRLSRFLRHKYGYLSLIDVGANIGDTILACVDSEYYNNDRFLAIEANPCFLQYLEKNCKSIKNFRFLEAYCSSSNGECNVKIDSHIGTATISQHNSGYRIDKKTVDAIVDEMKEYHKFNFLKIDTDGCDFQVIQGAQRWISKNLPAVLFECVVFENSRYVENFVETASMFMRSGYSKAIVYDNFGFIFGLCDFRKIADFKYSLIYQLTSKLYYFDFLVMKDEDLMPFLDREIAYFIDKMPKSLQQTVKAAAGL